MGGNEVANDPATASAHHDGPYSGAVGDSSYWRMPIGGYVSPANQPERFVPVRRFVRRTASACGVRGSRPGFRTSGRHAAVKASTAFCPPKPMELLTAARIRPGRGEVTTSAWMAGSWVVRLAVGGMVWCWTDRTV